jgi:hypothetical protein
MLGEINVNVAERLGADNAAIAMDVNRTNIYRVSNNYRVFAEKTEQRNPGSTPATILQAGNRAAIDGVNNIIIVAQAAKAGIPGVDPNINNSIQNALHNGRRNGIDDAVAAAGAAGRPRLTNAELDYEGDRGTHDAIIQLMNDALAAVGAAPPADVLRYNNYGNVVANTRIDVNPLNILTSADIVTIWGFISGKFPALGDRNLRRKFVELTEKVNFKDEKTFLKTKKFRDTENLFDLEEKQIESKIERLTKRQTELPGLRAEAVRVGAAANIAAIDVELAQIAVELPAAINLLRQLQTNEIITRRFLNDNEAL